MTERPREAPQSAEHHATHDANAAQRLAERVADGMFVNDRASRGLGMRIAGVGPGRAEMTMTVREDMLNGHGMCHGGFIFLLADSAFAFACNSYNRNTVAQGCSIDYLAPAHLGEAAVAVEQLGAADPGVAGDVDADGGGVRAQAVGELDELIEGALFFGRVGGAFRGHVEED